MIIAICDNCGTPHKVNLVREEDWDYLDQSKNSFWVAFSGPKFPEDKPYVICCDGTCAKELEQKHGLP